MSMSNKRDYRIAKRQLKTMRQTLKPIFQLIGHPGIPQTMQESFDEMRNQLRWLEVHILEYEEQHNLPKSIEITSWVTSDYERSSILKRIEQLTRARHESFARDDQVETEALEQRIHWLDCMLND